MLTRALPCPNCGCEPPIDCDGCSSAPPEEFQVVISGVLDGTCDQCTQWNGTFVVTRDHGTSGGTCIWRLDRDGEIDVCFGVSDPCDQLTVQITDLGGGTYRIRVGVANGAGSSCTPYQWSADIGSPFDCAALADYSVPFTGSDPFSGCGGATDPDAVLITAL
jgi:hypothetical protein